MGHIKKIGYDDLLNIFYYGGLKQEDYLTIEEMLYQRNIKTMTDICFF